MKLAFGSVYICALLVAPALADDALEAVQQGAFLPFTQSPSNVSLVRTFGSYDSARRSTVVESDVRAKLSEKFQAQADLTYESGSRCRSDPRGSPQRVCRDRQPRRRRSRA